MTEWGEGTEVDLATLDSKEVVALAVAVVYRPARLGGEAGLPASAMEMATPAVILAAEP